MRKVDGLASGGVLRIGLLRRSSFIFAAPVLLSAVWLGANSLRFGVADTLSRSFDASHLELAVRIAPGAPEVHARLGSYYLYSPESLDSQRAAREFRMAVALAPRRAALWQELARACLASGNQPCAEQAVARAVALSPMASRVWWQAGITSLAAGHPQRALGFFVRLLTLDPEYRPAVLRVRPLSADKRQQRDISSNTLYYAEGAGRKSVGSLR